MAKKPKRTLEKLNNENENIEAEENELSTGTNGIQAVWKFFSSMKLGLALILIISLVSIVGTLLPTDPQTGLPKVNLYGQIWFRGLLGLLCINLFVCSINRWKFIVRSLGNPRIKVSEGYLTKLKLFTSIRRKGSSSAESVALQSALTGRGYRVFTEDIDGVKYIAADKGRFGVIGSFITHLSFIIITVGAIYGGFMGYEGYINAPEGQTFKLTSDVQWSTSNQPSADDEFEVRVNRFWIDYATDGMVKDYYSNLTVIDEGKEILTKTIQVNDPLSYQGVKFYQSSYGDANGVAYTGLSVRYDPGVPFVWLGCGIMVLGITIAYLLQHRKIWAVIKEVNSITIMDIGAVTDKNKLGLEADYQAIINAVKSEIGEKRRD